MNAAEKQFSKYFKTMKKIEVDFAALNSHPDIYANWDVLTDMLRTQFNRLKQYGDNAYEMSSAQIFRIEEILNTAIKALREKQERAAATTEGNEIVVEAEAQLENAKVENSAQEAWVITGTTKAGNAVKATVSKSVFGWEIKYANVNATHGKIADAIAGAISQLDYNAQARIDFARIDAEFDFQYPAMFEDLYGRNE